MMEEAEILDQAFQLIFAFDEIVALGYRESVNLAQIRTFTEMDSHEEKVYQAVRQVSKSNTIIQMLFRMLRNYGSSCNCSAINNTVVLIKINSLIEGEIVIVPEKNCFTCHYSCVSPYKQHFIILLHGYN